MIIEESQSKHLQLMMNLSLLQSLKHKPSIQILPTFRSPMQLFPLITPPSKIDYWSAQSLPLISPSDPKLISQMSFPSILSPQSTILSYQAMDNRSTNDSSYFFSGNEFYLNGHKSNTAMSFNPETLLNKDDNFIGKKTKRNTIIINESKYKDNNKDKDSNNDIEVIEDIGEESPHVKHHSAPIKLMHNNKQKNLFETHLLKKQIEYREGVLMHHCEHNGCKLSYKTKKQKMSHHAKMDPECQKDSIYFLNMIGKVKSIIESLIKQQKMNEEDNNVKYMIEKYEKIMRELSLKEYAQLICGRKFDIPKK